MFSLLFILAYILIIFRALIVNCCTSKCLKKVNYIIPLDRREDEYIEYLKSLRKISIYKKLFKKFIFRMKMTIIYLCNLSLWLFKQSNFINLTKGQTLNDLFLIFLKILNSYFVFLSFAFMYIISIVSKIFNCNLDTQSNQFILTYSPDM
jgi:hypothetical protein